MDNRSEISNSDSDENETNEKMIGDVLKDEYMKNNCDSDKISKECNNFKLKKEIIERQQIQELEESESNGDRESMNEVNKIMNKDILYPQLDDPKFIIKIAEKKEFYDTKYDGRIMEIKEQSNIMNNASFELAPHQLFVKNFLSYNTPYNSLLLYHGLGTGKTCSAIGVCEEQRDYLNQMGIEKRTLIVASPNVQDNFRLQLFDKRKLNKVDGQWVITGCIGNKLLNEINPMNMKGITREKVIQQINNIINNSYMFVGYNEFANYVEKVLQVRGEFDSEEEKEMVQKRNMKYEFDGRLIVIDEVHNLNEDNKLAPMLTKVVLYTQNVRLLLLSATPMYNSYKEVIWLLNLMNMNDGRGILNTRDVFEKDGSFKKGKGQENEGEELLLRKATGYVSFVRGENPYTFPFRIYPNIFSPGNTFDNIEYPTTQLNGKKINVDEVMNDVLKTSIYETFVGPYQEKGYQMIINNFHNQKEEQGLSGFEELNSFGFTLLQKPLEALTIVYPSEDLDRYIEMNDDTNDKSKKNENVMITDTKYDFIGRTGLKQVMAFTDTKTPPMKGNFEYTNWVKDSQVHNRFFSQDKVGTYSAKIKNVCDSIYSTKKVVSEGVILIYCQYIDSGIIPLALALEEMGFSRYGKNASSLFKTPPSQPVSSKTMQPIEKGEKVHSAKYIMITGDPRLSPDNDYEVKAVTDDNNKNGDKIKVILISRAGSEGIDFKFIRQIHILDPWYNMNRIEQIIGRGVRNGSHKLLPFEKRNVQLYLYGSLLRNNSNIETADNYVYRLATFKAIQIGRVTRLLKQTAVDCLLNHDQTNFTQEKIEEGTSIKVKQVLSSGEILKDFKVGDVDNSSSCDYMKCDFKCMPDKDIISDEVNEYTYTESFVNVNAERLYQKVKSLFQDRFFYKKTELLHEINTPRAYPISQIYATLTHLINDKSKILIDKYGRSGNLVNIEEYYLFQPTVLDDKNIPLFERSVPLDYKHNMLKLKMKMKTKVEESGKESSKELGKETIMKPTEQNEIGELEIMEDIQIKYDTVKNIIDQTRSYDVSRGEENWYIHCGYIMRKSISDKLLNKDVVLVLLIEHLVDMLVFSEKLKLMNYIYNISDMNPNSIEYKVKEYLDTNIIKTSRETAMIMINGTKLNIKILKNKEWINALPEDVKDVEKETTKYLEDLRKYEISKVNGYFNYNIKINNMDFKVRFKLVGKSTGKRCRDTSKSDKIHILNILIGHDKFNKENTKGMVEQQLCALEEWLFRYNNMIKKDDKLWFFNYEKSILLQKELHE
jgi:hypothetical protein|tara:strand:- start:5469 stop:9299 length:3831 start_codon:yes stop_codon:yes gene_type:complete